MDKFYFGRVPSTFDVRDFNLSWFMPSGLPDTGIKSANWEFAPSPLDQGETPHCTGFSIANFGINYPTYTEYTNEDGHSFYYKAKEIDGEPNEENGSTIRSVAKVMRNARMVSNYAFAPDVPSIKWWLLNRGPMIVGTIWTESMLYPSDDNIIIPNSTIVGGHAYLLNEWTKDNYIGIQNSWGEKWGKRGKSYISEADFTKIFIRGGEALAAVELEQLVVTPGKKDCFVKGIINFFKEVFSS